MRVSVSKNGLMIDGKLMPLYSGEFHYWRVDNLLWGLILDKLVEAELKIISTYIPWSVHEIERGKFDFGKVEQNKNIRRFLLLCEEKNIKVIIRPGPHINAEITYFGYPSRILTDPEILSKSAEGTDVVLPAFPRMFPVPSYASEKFYDEVRIFFSALGEEIRDLIFPKGPIIAVQCDNELSFFFRYQPYDHDYSEASISLYHKFLMEKYETVDKINDTYHRNYKSINDIIPPIDFFPNNYNDLPYYLDWIEYKEYYICWGLTKIKEILIECGISGVPYFHNFPTYFPSAPFNINKNEKCIDVQGLDMYFTRKDIDKIFMGVTYAGSMSRLPFLPEFGCGIFPWWRPSFLRDEEFTTKCAFMYGIKGINFYMFVERERWYGSPIKRNGRIRDENFKYYKELLSFLKREKFWEYEYQPETILLLNREYERLLLASSLITPIPWEVIDLPSEWFTNSTPIYDFSDSIQIANRRQFRAFYKGFNDIQIPFVIGDSDIELNDLLKYKLVVIPTFEFMDANLQRKLLVYTLRGGTIVIGPRVPIRDSKMLPTTRLSSHLLTSTGRVAQMNYKGLRLEAIDLFDAPPFIKLDSKATAYIKRIEKGLIIFLGFVFQDLTGVKRNSGLVSIMERIADVAKIRPVYPPTDYDVKTAFHYNPNNNEKLIFVSNPTSEKKKTLIRTQIPTKFVEVFTRETFTEKNEITLEPYTIKIFKIESE